MEVIMPEIDLLFNTCLFFTYVTGFEPLFVPGIRWANS